MSPVKGLRAMVVVGLVLAGCSSVGCSSDDQVTVGSTAPADGATIAPSTSADPLSQIARYTVEVVATHPHDRDAFTQGLVMTADGRLFESIGGFGDSQVREVELETGEVIRSADLEDDMFGEGLTRVGDELVQLTWKDGVAIRWSIDDLEEVGRDEFEGEGWGLATDGDELLQSDGSRVITTRDAATFEPVRTFDVVSDSGTIDELNELEVVDGVLYANVWHSNEILMIDPPSGRVVGVIDASSIVPEGLDDPEAVLNGIAHRPGDPADRLLLTGKLWPVLHEVRVVPA